MKESAGAQKRKRPFLKRLLSSINFMVTEDVNTLDQRRAPRVECRCEVAFVDMNGQKSSGVLVDLSKSGIQLECPKKLRKGLTIAIKAPHQETLDRTAPLMATVKWCRKKADSGYAIGLALPPEVVGDPHWLKALLQQLGYDENSQRREFIRAKSDLPGRLLPEGAEETEAIEVEVRNLGMGGALLKAVYSLTKDSSFYLSLGPLEDLPILRIRGTILRVVEGDDHILYPTTFQNLSEEESQTLREYILKFSDR